MSHSLLITQVLMPFSLYPLVLAPHYLLFAPGAVLGAGDWGAAVLEDVDVIAGVGALPGAALAVEPQVPQGVPLFVLQGLKVGLQVFQILVPLVALEPDDAGVVEGLHAELPLPEETPQESIRLLLVEEEVHGREVHEELLLDPLGLLPVVHLLDRFGLHDAQNVLDVLPALRPQHRRILIEVLIQVPLEGVLVVEELVEYFVDQGNPKAQLVPLIALVHLVQDRGDLGPSWDLRQQINSIAIDEEAVEVHYDDV